jgi:hypothetical protein
MIEKIQAMWNAGQTIDQIAHRLQSTRGKISGLMYRARKEGMIFAEHKTDTAIREKRVIRDKKARVKTQRIAVDFDNEIPRLKFNECRFIVNTNLSRPIYCKAPISRVSYCETHASLCFVQKSRPQRA